MPKPTTSPFPCKRGFAGEEPAKVVHNRAQVLHQRLLLGLNPRNQPLVIGAARGVPAFRQWRERTRVGAELPPQTRHAMHSGRLSVQVAHSVVEAQALATGKLVEEDVPASPPHSGHSNQGRATPSIGSHSTRMRFPSTRMLGG